MGYLQDKMDELVCNDFKDIRMIDKDDLKVSLSKELDSIQKQIDKQMLLSTNLLKLYSEGTIHDTQFKLQNEGISNTLNTLMSNKEVVSNKIAHLPKGNTESFKKDVENLLSVPRTKWNNAMLKEIIEVMDVTVGKVVQIKLKIEK